MGGEIRNLTTFTRLMDCNNGFSLSFFFGLFVSFLWIGAQFPQEKFLSYARILRELSTYPKQRKKNEREKLLLFKRNKAVRFLISPKIKKIRIEVNKTMNPAFLLGTAFNIAYWHRKYHSGTICKGVSNAEASNALSGCEREEM